MFENWSHRQWILIVHNKRVDFRIIHLSFFFTLSFFSFTSFLFFSIFFIRSICFNLFVIEKIFLHLHFLLNFFHFVNFVWIYSCLRKSFRKQINKQLIMNEKSSKKKNFFKLIHSNQNVCQCETWSKYDKTRWHILKWLRICQSSKDVRLNEK